VGLVFRPPVPLLIKIVLLKLRFADQSCLSCPD